MSNASRSTSTGRKSARQIRKPSTRVRILPRLTRAIDTLDNATTSPEVAVECILTDSILLTMGEGDRRAILARMIRNGSALSSSIARVRAELVAAAAQLEVSRG